MKDVHGVAMKFAELFYCEV